MFNSQNDHLNNNVHNHIDGPLSHIFPCGSKRCQFQNNVSDTALIDYINVMFHITQDYFNKDYSNVIYLNNCNEYKLQNKGETWQNIHGRFS